MHSLTTMKPAILFDNHRKQSEPYLYNMAPSNEHISIVMNDTTTSVDGEKKLSLSNKAWTFMKKAGPLVLNINKRTFYDQQTSPLLYSFWEHSTNRRARLWKKKESQPIECYSYKESLGQVVSLDVVPVNNLKDKYRAILYESCQIAIKVLSAVIWVTHMQ